MLQNNYLYFNNYLRFQTCRPRYALFSWGLPALVVTVTIIMDSLPEELTSGLKVPEVGRKVCFLGDDGFIYYFHIVNLPLLLFNLVSYLLGSLLDIQPYAHSRFIFLSLELDQA